MKRIGLSLVLALCASVMLVAQSTHISTSGTLPASCRVGDVYYKTGTSAGLYNCTASNTWTVVAAGTVTATGTLTANKALIGNGTTDVTVSSATGVAHLSSGTLTGSNVNVASEITGTTPVANGGTNLTSATDDNVMVGNGTTWQSKALTDCDASTNAVTYDTTTNAFGCNTITGSGGGGIGTVTNTGTLTSGKAVIGNGGADVTVSSASGVAHLSSGTLSGSNVALASEVSGVLPGANGGGLVLLEQHTASSSASLDFTTCLSSTYDEYQFDFVGIRPATDSTSVLMRFSSDSGSSYDSGSNYQWTRFLNQSAASSNSGSTSDTSINLGGLTTATSKSLNGRFTLSGAVQSSIFMAGNGHTSFYGSDGSWNSFLVSGVYKTLASVNAVRFIVSSGNMASGTIRCYGIAKSDGGFVVLFVLFLRKRQSRRWDEEIERMAA